MPGATMSWDRTDNILDINGQTPVGYLLDNTVQDAALGITKGQPVWLCKEEVDSGRDRKLPRVLRDDNMYSGILQGLNFPMLQFALASNEMNALPIEDFSKFFHLTGFVRYSDSGDDTFGLAHDVIGDHRLVNIIVRGMVNDVFNIWGADREGARLWFVLKKKPRSDIPQIFSLRLSRSNESAPGNQDLVYAMDPVVTNELDYVPESLLHYRDENGKRCKGRAFYVGHATLIKGVPTEAEIRCAYGSVDAYTSLPQISVMFDPLGGPSWSNI